jgi:hypothetical protein
VARELFALLESVSGKIAKAQAEGRDLNDEEVAEIKAARKTALAKLRAAVEESDAE